MSEAARVELWSAVPGPEHLELAARHLPADERARLGRFRSEAPALEYAAAHVLLRRLLSTRAPIAPADWRFLIGAHGRPDLDPSQAGLPNALRGLSVNLAHTRGRVLVGLSLDGALGVDVERRARPNDLRRLAEAKFAEAERDWLSKAYDEETFRRRFFEVWTLKEAYLKARGTGITVPLADFAFRLEGREAPRASFAPGFDPRPEDWSFRLLELGPEHQAAVALRTRDGEQALEVTLRPESELPETGP